MENLKNQSYYDIVILKLNNSIIELTNKYNQSLIEIKNLQLQIEQLTKPNKKDK